MATSNPVSYLSNAPKTAGPVSYLSNAPKPKTPDYGSYDTSGVGQTEEELTAYADEQMVDYVAQKMIELDMMNSNLDIFLTDEEKDTFLKKAEEMILPYYEKRFAELEAGIKEGKIRTAEDLLIELRNSEADFDAQFKEMDLRNAETEEEFTDTLAQMTAQEGEDLETNKLNWIQRINSAGMSDQTGGLALKPFKREQGNIERKATEAETNLTRETKYTQERIALARQVAERKRTMAIGSPDQIAESKAGLVSEAGLENADISEIELARQRAARGIAPVMYGDQATTALEEEKKTAVLSRQRELEENEKAIKKTRAQQEAIANAKSNLSNLT